MYREDEKRLKLWETALLCALCVTLLAALWAQGRAEDISSSLVRLHVLAVSDEDEEQAIKLRVRDAVLEYLAPRLEEAENKSAAQELLLSDLDGVQRAASAAAEGRNVTVTLTHEYYPTRSYAGFSLPAGSYDSLRVVLGEGKGHNWWCVVFPPICLSAEESEIAAEQLGEENMRLLAGDGEHVLGFRLLELWGELMEIIREMKTA